MLPVVSDHAVVPATDHAADHSIRANGIRLAYQTFGARQHPPILLIGGLGMQSISWDDDGCRRLARSGHFVIRFDNRDCGRSSHLAGLGRPPLLAVRRGRVAPPYTIDDLADDAIALLANLGLDRAHIVGVSMGGFIAQSLALRRPDLVASLTLAMTSTGAHDVGRPRLRLLPTLLSTCHHPDRATAVAGSVRIVSRLAGGPGRVDVAAVETLAGRCYDRAFDPAGQRRQLAAVLAQRDRTADLARLDVPVLVVHGRDDPLVSVSGGRALLAAIPGVRYVELAGTGHYLDATAARRLTDEVVRLIADVGATSCPPTAR